MGDSSKGTYVVGVGHGPNEAVDIQRLEAAISTLKGVIDVEFNYLTRKLMVSYDGLDETRRRIDEEIEGARKGR